jgi:formylglycine-generating enzyme required for sulfatase activity
MNDGREDEKASDPRVQRGDSLLNFEGYARCALRVKCEIDHSSNNMGFRVVASPQKF